MLQEIMTLEEIKKKLSDKRLYVVSEKTGISYPVLRKLADGVESNYTIETLKKISEYLSK